MNFRRRRVAAIAVVAAVAAVTWIVLDAAGIIGPVDKHGAHVEHITIESKAVGRKLSVSVVIPKGASGQDRRPLLVFLHGRSEGQNTFLNESMFKALAKLGRRAPMIAFPYGGDHSYWHDRAGGAWGTYVMREVIPIVSRRFHARAKRVAIGGISMGGFGAYDLARLHPGRFCAVGGHSPAIWPSAGQTAAGAFDDAEDFARHDVFAAARAGQAGLTGQPVWLDAGDKDPFRPWDREFVSLLRSAGAPLTVRTWPGSHDRSYWNRHWNSYLHFYAAALAKCRR
jgi:S-formylglutathione hydrolase FrmB